MENREKKIYRRETKPDNRSLKRASVFFLPSLFDLIKSEKIEKEREKRLLCIMRRTNVSAYSIMNSQSE